MINNILEYQKITQYLEIFIHLILEINART